MYGRAFESMYTGSMCGAGPEIFAVWGYVIAHCKGGDVELNPIILATVIGMTVDSVKTAISKLCAPDPDSRNPDEEGRRLVHEGGVLYRVVSHDRYSEIRREEDRRRQNREAQRRFRLSAETKLASAIVSTRQQSSCGVSAISRSDSYSDSESYSGSESDRDKESNAREAPPRATSTPKRLPLDWTPLPLSIAEREGVALTDDEIAAQLPRFRDHFAAATGARGVHADWNATWRNWLRRAPEFNQGTQSAKPGAKLSAFERQLVRIQMLAEKERGTP